MSPSNGTRLSLLLLALSFGMLAPGGAAWADDWPQWRGPNRDGCSTEGGLLDEWPEGGPTRLWLSDTCGLGYSGPAIVGGKLYIMGTRDETERLFCLDAATGDELWDAEMGPVYRNDWGDGPRGTPTVVGGRIYALAAQGNVVCVNAENGRVLWNTSLQDLGGEIPQWGYSESPLLLGDRVLITPGGGDGAIAALNARSGKLIWQNDHNTEVAHYSSIVAATMHGREVCFQLLPTEAVCFEPDRGEVLWSVPWPKSWAVIPTPLVHGNSVYLTSGYGAGCRRYDFPEDFQATEVFANKEMTNHHGDALLHEGHVYGHSDGKGWVCQDFETGEAVWRERRELGKGALTYADKHFYCVSEDEGEVVLIDASPEGWNERGRFTLDPQSEQRKQRGRIWTHPVIADGRLYLRDQELVYCFDIRGGN